ncbi:MAG: hypothetical protein R6X06_09930 [Gammaproteobacteria bacterium]
MQTLVISLLIILLGSGNSTPAMAQQTAPVMEMVVIPLKHRSAEDAVALLKPFMHPEGAISGTGYTLVIRSTAQNITDLRDILADFDSEIRRLQISVSFDRQFVLQEMQAHAQIESRNDEVSGEVGVIETRSRQGAAGVQRVQVLQGQWANIQTGKRFPIAQRQTNPDGTVTETISYEQVGSGFQVFPQIAEQTAILRIRPFHSSLSREGGGQIDSQSLETTVSAPLGKWVELGGIIEQLESGGDARHYATGPRGQAARGLFLKVEQIH